MVLLLLCISWTGPANSSLTSVKLFFKPVMPLKVNSIVKPGISGSLLKTIIELIDAQGYPKCPLRNDSNLIFVNSEEFNNNNNGKQNV